ncbi:hypothetical protein [Endozoicomonas sp. G2_2]|uniref:hypothetical protein n=1 Tax=Endozoicomonas sp. G2_2 TaxID=2821092 RepID=UPI001FFDEE1F|nr:hypothetical protein [Endozoicomonas sp. G2_2]
MDGKTALARLRHRAVEIARRHKGKQFAVVPFARYVQERSDAQEIEALLAAIDGRKCDVGEALERALLGVDCGLPRLCLLSTVLFDHVDKAAQCFRQDSPASSARTDNSVPSNALMRAYYECHGNYSHTALVLAKSRVVVAGQLQRRGAPNLAGLATASLMTAVLDFYDGQSLYDACRRHQISYDCVESLIRQSSKFPLVQCAQRIVSDARPTLPDDHFDTA